MTKHFFVQKLILAAACTALSTGLWAADELDARQRSIVAIASHTANGDLEALERNFAEGLKAGLTVNEIKEVLVQLYAYTGFPRSLNAIHCFMKVMDERQKAGIKDPVGKEPSPVPAGINKDEYGAKVRARLGGRDVIAATIGALGGMTDTQGQMMFHFNAAMNTGTSQAQMRDFIRVLQAEVGAEHAQAAQSVLERVLKNRAQKK